jgi:hypothetical protein
LRNEPPYFREWRIERSSKGFAFREVGSGMGICGHRPTVRELVISALFVFSDEQFRVEVTEEPFEDAKWEKHFAAVDRRNEDRWSQFRKAA